jgi:hypothetical protein
MNRTNKDMGAPISAAPAAQFEQAAIRQAFSSMVSRYTSIESGFFYSGCVVTDNTVASTVAVAITEGYASLDGEPIYVPAQSASRDVTQVMWLAPIETAVDSVDYLDADGNPIEVEIERTLALTVGSNYPALSGIVKLDASSKEQLDTKLLGSAAKQVGDVWIRNVNLANFDLSTGLGLNGTIEQGVAFCDGRNGTIDLRGLVPAGFVTTGATTPLPAGVVTNSTLGDTFGKEQHQLTVAEMPAHSHSYTRTNLSNAGGGGSLEDGSPIILTSPSESTSIIGSGQAHDNRQPTIAVMYVQKVA